MASPPRNPDVPLLVQGLNEMRHLATAGQPGQLASIQETLININNQLTEMRTTLADHHRDHTASFANQAQTLAQLNTKIAAW